MYDVDTFLTILYVTIDDFDKTQPAAPARPGPAAALSASEVLTLALFSQWSQFESERAFYRYAVRHLRPLFPSLPHRSQLNRLLRASHDGLVAIALWLAQTLQTRDDLYEALDGTGVPVRNVKRRGAGWLAGQAEVGWCPRVGWYEGFRLLTAVTRQGVITGFALGPATRKDQPLAETFLAARRFPQARLPSVGTRTPGWYVVDTGFEGRALLAHWQPDYGAQVVCQPNRSRPHGWPKALRRWLAGIRQISETIFARLLLTFGLEHARPHLLRGLQARLAAKVGLHNFCLWLNVQVGRPPLAYADLLDW
jgi:hypothetical protein